VRRLFVLVDTVSRRNSRTRGSLGLAPLAIHSPEHWRGHSGGSTPLRDYPDEFRCVLGQKTRLLTIHI